MLITMRELRKAGIDKEFIKEVREYIPKTVADIEAAYYLKQIVNIALEDGLVGPSMMRQIARMRSNSAVNRGLYSRIIEFKKEAEKILAKRAAREAKKEAEEEPTPKKRKRKKIEPVAEEKEPEPEKKKAPAKKKQRKKLKAKKEAPEPEPEPEEEVEPVMTVEFEYEGYEFQSIQHPDAPAALKKFDNYWPVPLDKLWKYKTSGPVTFPIFTAKARTKKQHLAAAKRKGVTLAQFEAIWKQWSGKKGRELGWVMEEVEEGQFQLRALDPLTELIRFD